MKKKYLVTFLPLVSTILLVVITVSIFGQSQKATLTDGKIICGQDMP